MICFVIAVLAAAPQTAKVPDFSGTWQLDASKTTTSGKPNVTAPVRIKYVMPTYPLQAQYGKVAGVVTMEATIGKDGRVADARVIASIPMLDQAALNAVRQWRFTPTMVNGQPVPVILAVTVTFSLSSVEPTRAVSVASTIPGSGAQTRTAEIVQNSETLVVTVRNPDTTTVYRLDGTESHNSVPGPGGTTRDSVAKSHWDGDKLITTITTGAGGGPQETTETRYLEDGHLIVETVRPNPSGAEPGRVREVYNNKVGGSNASSRPLSIARALIELSCQGPSETRDRGRPVQDGQLPNATGLTLSDDVAISPASGNAATVFIYSGRGFTGSSGATSHLKWPDGSEYPTLQIATTANGTFTTTTRPLSSGNVSQ